MKFPYKAVDLTHTISSDAPTWEGDCGFSHDIMLDYASCTTPVKFRVQTINMVAGLGTHIDAPAHCIPGGNKRIGAFMFIWFLQLNKHHLKQSGEYISP